MFTFQPKHCPPPCQYPVCLSPFPAPTPPPPNSGPDNIKWPETDDPVHLVGPQGFHLIWSLTGHTHVQMQVQTDTFELYGSVSHSETCLTVTKFRLTLRLCLTTFLVLTLIPESDKASTNIYEICGSKSLWYIEYAYTCENATVNYWTCKYHQWSQQNTFLWDLIVKATILLCFWVGTPVSNNTWFPLTTPLTIFVAIKKPQLHPTPNSTDYTDYRVKIIPSCKEVKHEGHIFSSWFLCVYLCVFLCTRTCVLPCECQL